MILRLTVRRVGRWAASGGFPVRGEARHPPRPALGQLWAGARYLSRRAGIVGRSAAYNLGSKTPGRSFPERKGDRNRRKALAGSPAAVAAIAAAGAPPALVASSISDVMMTPARYR